MMKEGDVHVRRFLDIPETLSKLEFLKFNQQLMSWTNLRVALLCWYKELLWLDVPSYTGFLTTQSALIHRSAVMLCKICFWHQLLVYVKE